MSAEAPVKNSRGKATGGTARSPAIAPRAREGQARPRGEQRNRGPVGSVVHALAILRYIALTREPAGVTAIARAIGINPSSCFNILRTLVAEEFVERDDETKTYMLGVAPLDLARSVIDENGAFSYLRADMQRLADTFSVTTTLWRMTRSERWVLVGLTESLALARIHMTIGQRLPLYGGAMGRCLAAHRRAPQSELLCASARCAGIGPPPRSIWRRWTRPRLRAGAWIRTSTTNSFLDRRPRDRPRRPRPLLRHPDDVRWPAQPGRARGPGRSDIEGGRPRFAKSLRPHPLRPPSGHGRGLTATI